MTKKERAKQNRENAKKSTGPRTEAGKNASRRNALKHGFSASTLGLDAEETLQIQAHVETWTAACSPANEAETALVNQIAADSVRLNRLATAEAEILAEQVREATGDWDASQKLKLVELTRLIRDDPATAVIGLEGFGLGLKWLIERWNDFPLTIDQMGCWPTVDLFWEAARLRGLDAARLKDSTHDEFEFFTAAIWLVPEWQKYPTLAAFLKENTPPRWYGRHGDAQLPAEEIPKALELVRDWIAGELARLNALLESRTAIEAASRESAPLRAMAPKDTPDTRLFFRYLKGTESSFDRAVKTLQKLQNDRVKEAAKAASRNEAKGSGGGGIRNLYNGCSVVLNGRMYDVDEKPYGKFILSPVESLMHTWVPEDEPGSQITV